MTPDSGKPAVLFVDDEERIVNLMRVIFRPHYTVHTATSGTQALEIIGSQTVHVIVSDQRMPGMTGIEVLSQVRDLSPNTIRILLTGYADLAAMVGSVNEGEVYRFISKPWDNEELRQTLREAVEIATSTAISVTAALAASPPTQAMDHLASSSLLLIEDNAQEREWFLENFSADYALHTAADISEALDILERHDVGVIVSDARVRGQDTLQLLRVLKQQYPMIMTVMLTRSADSDLVIRLINEARVCRVAFKPLKHGPVDLALKAAMRQHRVYRGAPVLVQQQKAANSASVAKSPAAQGIMERLRTWRVRWSW
jgi:DNA-binding NtrC family response regulator